MQGFLVRIIQYGMMNFNLLLKSFLSFPYENDKKYVHIKKKKQS